MADPRKPVLTVGISIPIPITIQIQTEIQVQKRVSTLDLSPVLNPRDREEMHVTTTVVRQVRVSRLPRRIRIGWAHSVGFGIESAAAAVVSVLRSVRCLGQRVSCVTG
jgi:hypothetical protein